jgi:hypothetical protein
MSFAGDDGAAPVQLLAALAGYASGEVSGQKVLDALGESRVLVPVVALLDEVEIGEDGLKQDKQSTMATVLIEQPGGERALLAFTSLPSLTGWRADARPVPVMAAAAAQSALAEGASALLVDVAGPTPFVVTGPELVRLASHRHPPVATDHTAVDRIGALSRELVRVVGRPAGLLDARLVDALLVDGGTSARLVVIVDPALDPIAYESLMATITSGLAESDELRALLPNGLALTVLGPDANFSDSESLFDQP